MNKSSLSLKNLLPLSKETRPLLSNYGNRQSRIGQGGYFSIYAILVLARKSSREGSSEMLFTPKRLK